MAGKKKGAPKTGGRDKGTPNKVTATAKEMVVQLVDYGLEKAKKKLDQIDDPKEYLDTLAKFISYVVPKKTENETTVAIPVLKTQTEIIPSAAPLATSEKDVEL